jgi:amino acid transporter, AAT family
MTTAIDERYGVGYLEERRLAPRWPAPVAHLVNIVALLAVFYATWWIFQDSPCRSPSSSCGW